MHKSSGRFFSGCNKVKFIYYYFSYNLYFSLCFFLCVYWDYWVGSDLYYNNTKQSWHILNDDLRQSYLFYIKKKLN